MLSEHSISEYRRRLEAIGHETIYENAEYIEEVDLSSYQIKPVDTKAPTDAHPHASDIHHGHHTKKHYVMGNDPRVLGYILYEPSDEKNIINRAVLFEC